MALCYNLAGSVRCKLDQTIGIGYQVDGVSQVTKANTDVIASFQQVVNKVGSMATTLGAFASNMAGLTKNMKGLGASGEFVQSFKGSSTSINAAAKASDRFNTSIGGTPGRVDAAASKIRELTSAVNQYSSAVGSIKPIPMSPIPGTGPDKGGGGSAIHNRDIFPMVPKFMFAWRAGSEAIQAAQFGFNDILLGRSREKMAAGLGQLSPLGFDTDLKSKVEASAKVFNQRFWTISAESYVDAMSQTASAFDVTKLGFSNLQRMNEASLKLSATAKMSTEKAAELLSKTLLAQITQMPADVAERLNKGLTADVKGYGKVDMGGLSEAVTAQISKTVAISSIWGPGIQSGFRGALPTLLERGYSLPAALAMVGAYADVGFQPGQGGKSVRDIYEREPVNFAKTLAYGAGLWQSESAQLDPQTLAQNKRQNKITTEALLPIVNKYLSNEELAPELFLTVGKIITQAEAEGHSLKEFGFSQYYLPMIRQTVKKPFQDRIADANSKIAGASYDETGKIVESQMQDAGTAYQRITSAFNNLATTMADTSWAHAIAGPVSKNLNFIRENLEMQRKTAKMTHDQITAAYLEKEDQLIQDFGLDQARNILNNAMRANKGVPSFEGGGFWGSMFQTTGELGSLWDNKYVSPFDAFSMSDEWKDYYRDFWDNSIIGPLKEAGATWDSYAQQVYAAMDYIPNKFVELFDMIGSAIDGVKAKVAPYIPKFESPPGAAPKPEEYGDMPLSERMAVPFMSMGGSGMGAPPQIVLTSQIENRLQLDGRVIAQVVADIIQQNRDVHYHGYGGDPMGFVT